MPIVPSFQAYSLAEAESELVGACIDHESALVAACQVLAVDDFRSEYADDLRRIFYVLCGWASKSLFDRETNRDRLALYFPDVYLDGLWCPYGIFPDYVAALASAIKDSNLLLDDAVYAQKRWRWDNPLLPSSSHYRPKNTGFTGGISL